MQIIGKLFVTSHREAPKVVHTPLNLVVRTIKKAKSRYLGGI